MWRVLEVGTWQVVLKGQSEVLVLLGASGTQSKARGVAPAEMGVGPVDVTVGLK